MLLPTMIITPTATAEAISHIDHALTSLCGMTEIAAHLLANFSTSLSSSTYRRFSPANSSLAQSGSSAPSCSSISKQPLRLTATMATSPQLELPQPTFPPALENILIAMEEKNPGVTPLTTPVRILLILPRATPVYLATLTGRTSVRVARDSV